MHLAVADVELFSTVIPAFIDALPRSPWHDSATTHLLQPEAQNQIHRANVINILRFEIQQLPEVLTKDAATYVLSDDLFRRASDALEDVLSLLDDLVDSEIVRCKGDIRHVPVGIFQR